MELLLCERIILESLASGEKNLEQIEHDSGLAKSAIGDVLGELKHKNFITEKCMEKSFGDEVIYHLNRDFLSKIFSKKSVRLSEDQAGIVQDQLEIADLLQAFVGPAMQGHSLQIFKLWMNRSEEALITQKMQELRVLLQHIKRKNTDESARESAREERRQMREPLRAKKVVVLGVAQYGTLVSKDLN